MKWRRVVQSLFTVNALHKICCALKEHYCLTYLTSIVCLTGAEKVAVTAHFPQFESLQSLYVLIVVICRPSHPVNICSPRLRMKLKGRTTEPVTPGDI